MAMRLNENLDDNGEMHEINVTPFIDVMLVLLIIFMVAAPLATVDVKVNLPASSSQPQSAAGSGMDGPRQSAHCAQLSNSWAQWPGSVLLSMRSNSSTASQAVQFSSSASYTP